MLRCALSMPYMRANLEEMSSPSAARTFVLVLEETTARRTPLSERDESISATPGNGPTGWCRAKLSSYSLT